MSELRKLRWRINSTSQTAKATEDISAQIVAVRPTGSLGGVIGSIDEIAIMIASAVEGRGSAIREIACKMQAAA